MGKQSSYERHLVKCPHCNADVLDHMTECPECKGKLQSKYYEGSVSSKTKKMLSIALAVVAVALIVIYLTVKG